MKTQLKFRIFLMLVMFFLLVVSINACSNRYSQASLLTSGPKDPIPIATMPFNTEFVYRTEIILSVNNVDRAIENAVRTVSEYGGYLTNSKTWYRDGQKITTLIFTVPSIHFDYLRHNLVGLGKLISETTYGEPIEVKQYLGNINYSTISLQLQPSSFISPLPPFTINGWKPIRTFNHAFSVFITIFGFLVDILIWVSVVIGPFLVFFLIIRAGIKWYQRKTASQELAEKSE